jgi:cytosine/uracil/thiamine/allantoin permease
MQRANADCDYQFGLHAYLGGLAVTVILNALSRSFMEWKNTLPVR